MRNITIDRFSEKQARIDRFRKEACSLYSTLWSNMIAEWNAPDSVDRVWLTYSANYLFRTKNVRWAIDPLTLHWRIQEAPKVEAARDLSNLSFVLLTHDHNDHLDIDSISALRDAPITWIVPEFILHKVMNQAGLPREKIIVPFPLQPVELNGLHILPFEGRHWARRLDGGIKQIPAMGYLIELNGRCWLFPGDTRAYDTAPLLDVDSVDDVFAHLWLGGGAALNDDPPLLGAFCRFFVDLNPHRLILTHLHEFGRDANDFWDESHVDIVRSKIREMSTNTQVICAFMGESVPLKK